MRRGEPGYANTKAGAECTTVSAKYAHPQVPYLMLWDVPGGGTDAHPGATYFSDKCLDLFDLLVLCYDGRWSEVNTLIVREAARTGTSLLILHTNTDTHIGNMVAESGKRMTEAAAFAELKPSIARLWACRSNAKGHDLARQGGWNSRLYRLTKCKLIRDCVVRRRNEHN